MALSGEWLVKALMRISRYLNWREFVVAFFVVAFGASLPDLFVGISSALSGIPELYFGDMISGNVIDLTLAVSLAVFIGRSAIRTDSKLVQKSALFTFLIAILPLFLAIDGAVSKGDGLVLILSFFLYASWVFLRGERFHKIYDGDRARIKDFFYDIGVLIMALVMMLLSAQGIIRSAVYFGQAFNLPLILVGILFIGLGNALPETYFAIVSARREQNWMVLGNLMGSIISCATLVLGITALIHPIKITNLPSVAIARFFLILAAAFFLVFTVSGKKISRKEAVFLLLVYLLFILIEILVI